MSRLFYFFTLLTYHSTLPHMWYYAVNDQQSGPISKAELQQKLQGELTPDTMVWKDGMAAWTKAGEVTELFATTTEVGSAPPITPITPNSQSQSPYAAPSSAGSPMATGQEYPFPVVKRANFALLASLKIIGMLCIVAGYGFMFSEMFKITEARSAYVNTQSLERMNDENVAEHKSVAEPEEIATDSYESSSHIDYEDSATDQQHSVSPSELSKGLTASMLMIFGGFIIFSIGYIVGCVYIYRAWKIIQPSGVSTTPGQAVGFLFIPFFSLYWIFIAHRQWAVEWNNLTRRHSSLANAPQGSEGVFLAMAIAHCSSLFTSVLGMGAGGVLNLIGMKSMCNVINYAAEQSQKQK